MAGNCGLHTETKQEDVLVEQAKIPNKKANCLGWRDIKISQYDNMISPQCNSYCDIYIFLNDKEFEKVLFLKVCVNKVNCDKP